ncbi:MAG: LSU ribosomal protein L25p [uncultured Thiotrichaceae bacterium]|uniref:Large ribosomal subunit protein bL25 n=1 Tax=uncultured Thiotrichaceae bacterium TaxID=298394 RepID=A0A6S6SVL5_9GAMM|nr:MAG: LSU ribosomal protein L25p [uncultured Thiotrichaceae bacterium]
MSDQIVLHAKKREEQGKGASRRLRKEGLVPAIIYGAGKEPSMIALQHSKLLRYEQEDSFFASILKVEIDGGDEENVLIRDYQRDPVKPKILHIDLLRVNMAEKIHTSVPLHFINDEMSVGVKEGGIMQRLIVEVDIVCLPTALPEYIEVDVSDLDIGGSIHISDIKAPEGVELMDMVHMEEADDEHKSSLDLAIVSVQAPRGASTADEDEGAPVAPDASEDDA